MKWYNTRELHAVMGNW